VQTYALFLDFYKILPLVMTTSNAFTSDDILITNIDDEIDGWILYEERSQGHECTHFCCVCFGLAGVDVMVTLKVLLWIFLCNLIDVCSINMQESYALEKEVKISNFFHKGLHGKGLVNIASLGYLNFRGIGIGPFFTFDKS
jgi:hypothetical protein